jgi:hypothetical protein
MRKIVPWIATVIGLGNWLKNFTKIDETVRRVVYWVAFFSLVSAAMSWVADHITPISQYGWGAVVFAGIGAACVLTLVVCAMFMTWHYFNPLPGEPATSSGKGQEAPALDDISLRLAEAERGIAQNKAGLEGLRLEVAMLTRSLRARDAEAMIKEADQVIMCTAKKILEEPYPDEAAWVADYAVWETAMRQIDNLMSQWQPHDKPFLDFRPKDLEGAPAPPPQSSIRFVTNIIWYKTAWLAQQRYANRREGILKYLFSKAGELPG